MELSTEKHQECLASLGKMIPALNQNATGATYEVQSGGLGRFLFYKKNQDSEESTQIATIHLTGAGGTMQQDINAPKDLEVLKRSAWEMCMMLSTSNPEGNYTLKFKGPDAKAIKGYVRDMLGQGSLTSKFTFVGGDAQSVRPNVFGQPASLPSSASFASSGGSEGGSEGARADEDSASNPYLNPTTS